MNAMTCALEVLQEAHNYKESGERNIDYLVCNDGVVIVSVENNKMRVEVIEGKPLIAEIDLNFLEKED